MQASGIPVPNHIIVNREKLPAGQEDPEGFIETEDYVELNGETFELLSNTHPMTEASISSMSDLCSLRLFITITTIVPEELHMHNSPHTSGILQVLQVSSISSKPSLTWRICW